MHRKVLFKFKGDPRRRPVKAGAILDSLFDEIRPFSAISGACFKRVVWGRGVLPFFEADSFRPYTVMAVEALKTHTRKFFGLDFDEARVRSAYSVLPEFRLLRALVW